MIFRKALLRELAITALASFSVLIVITLSTVLVRLLGRAAKGKVAAEGVAAFLGFSMLDYLPILLSLTLFIAVLLTLGRAYRESEMAAWFSAGQSITAWINPVMIFAAPIVIAIGGLSFYLSPWAEQKSDELKRIIETRDDVATVAPGIFKESKHADRVYFVESLSDIGTTVNNIFIQSMQHQRLGVVFAQRGFQEIADNGDRFIVLADGRRYEGTPGTPEYRIIEFARYAMRIEPYEMKVDTPPVSALPTSVLIKHPSPDHRAELVWRASLPVSALILVLLAIPLSFANPRASRSLGLMTALLVYMIYSNLMSVSKAWVAQEKIPVMVGAWGVHLLMLTLLLAFFMRRLYAASGWRRKK